MPHRRIGPPIGVPVLAGDAPVGACAEGRRLAGLTSHGEFTAALDRFRRTVTESPAPVGDRQQNHS